MRRFEAASYAEAISSRTSSLPGSARNTSENGKPGFEIMVGVWDGADEESWQRAHQLSAEAVWAARSAVAGTVVNAGFVYGNNITYRDITSGNNGADCLTGYDLVTGRGSWTGATP